MSWTCPKCGREFMNTNQDHFCIEVSAIDEYIAAQTAEVQPILQSIRETIRSVAPDAVERISWRMPTFWAPAKSKDFEERGDATKQGENIIHFAAFKKHIGLYPGAEAVEVFAERLTGYNTSKGAIQLPLGKPIDHKLIADIVQWRAEHLIRK